MPEVTRNQPLRRKRTQGLVVCWSWRIAKGLAALLVLYLSILVAGLIPVNRGFQASEAGVTIYVISNEVHADVIVPLRHELHDWTPEFQATQFVGDISQQSHVAFGWGDRGFYLHTPTWSQLKLSTAANALLLPSETCMRVAFTRPEYYSDASSITLSAPQYRQLVSFLEASFRRDAVGKVQQIHGYAYGRHDAFFEAVGQYHLFNTCNSWAGRGLQQAGVCTPWLTPLPGMPMMYFPDEEQEGGMR